MRALRMNDTCPKARGYARHVRQLGRWSDEVAAQLPERLHNGGLGEWNAYAKPPVRMDWAYGKPGLAYRREVLRAVVKAAAGWHALRKQDESQKVVAYLYPEDLWGSSLDLYWDADKLHEAWDKEVAKGDWVPLPLGSSLLRELGMEGLMPEWGVVAHEAGWEDHPPRSQVLWLLGDVPNHIRGVPSEA